MSQERERMQPEEIRSVIDELSVSDKVILESSTTHKLEVDDISENRLRLIGPQGGRKWLYPSPEGNTNSGNDPVQIQGDSQSSDHRRVWYIEQLESN